jgi:hypothetical protein
MPGKGWIDSAFFRLHLPSEYPLRIDLQVRLEESLQHHFELKIRMGHYNENIEKVGKEERLIS